jgi:hypothetical protein
MASSDGQRTRRAAQRRTARQIRAGTYQRGPAGRAYARAVARGIAGRQLPSVPAGSSGAVHEQREFANADAAIAWGQKNLPPGTLGYVMAKGTLAEYEGATREAGTRRQWAPVTRWVTAVNLDREQGRAKRNLADRFTSYQRIILRWRAV